MCSPYPEFVLADVICIEKALKGTEIVFVLTVLVLTRFYYIEKYKKKIIFLDTINIMFVD